VGICWTQTQELTADFARLGPNEDRNHYVPEWYQKSFFPSGISERRFSLAVWIRRARKPSSTSGNFKHPNDDYAAFQPLLLYLTVQKLRTPKGSDYLAAAAQTKRSEHFHLLT
jgi:hypothetical protein